MLELPAGSDGARRQLRRGGYRSKAVAVAARDFLAGADVASERGLMSTGQWLDLWLATRAELAVSTRRIYRQHIEDYLKPELGSFPLVELTVGKAQAMFTVLMRRSAACGRPLSAATLQRIRAVLHVALNGAIRRGLIAANPAHLVELPSGRRPTAVVWTAPRVAHWRASGVRPVVAVWTAEQPATFLAHARGHRFFVLFHLVALLGLRRGEAAGMRWCDVDLDARVLMVSHQVRDDRGRAVVCPPKTPASV